MKVIRHIRNALSFPLFWGQREDVIVNRLDGFVIFNISMPSRPEAKIAAKSQIRIG
jgi:hypothetical protein